MVVQLHNRSLTADSAEVADTLVEVADTLVEVADNLVEEADILVEVAGNFVELAVGRTPAEAAGT